MIFDKMHKLNVCVTETFECEQTVDIWPRDARLEHGATFTAFLSSNTSDPPRESFSGKNVVGMCHGSVNLKLINIDV